MTAFAGGRRAFDAVVFDLDGTLLDSTAQIADAINAVLHDDGLDPLSVPEAAGHIGWGARRLVETVYASRGRSLTDAEAVPRLAAYVDALAARAWTSSFFPGASALVRRLARDGFRLGVCTNKPEAIARRCLEADHLAGCFGAIVGGDTGFGLKPAPAPLRAALSMLAVAPARSLFVGDSTIDGETGRVAGVRVAIVTHGGDGMAAGACDFRIHRLEELVDILRGVDLGVEA
jgi:phosphoglycolate phosphatase